MTTESKKSNVLQIRLSTLLLLMVIIGLGTAMFITNQRNQKTIDQLNVRIDKLELQLPEYHVRRQLITMKQELADLQTRLGPQHPKIRSLELQISQMEKLAE